MKKVGIIGFGRFGKLLASLLASRFEVYIVESALSNARQADKSGYKLLQLESLAKMDYIFLAVPISAIEEVLVRLTPFVHQDQVVIDVCSVKVYPVRLMKQYLKNVQILATHPMFGVDSAKKGLRGLQVAFCPVRIKPENLQTMREFWEGEGVTVVETTPKQHDKDTVYSQAFTHTIARIILGMDMRDVTLRTRNFTSITEVASLSAHNSEQLFHDMLCYNPYFPKMKQELEKSLRTVNAQLNAIETEQSSVNPFKSI